MGIKGKGGLDPQSAHNLETYTVHKAEVPS